MHLCDSLEGHNCIECISTNFLYEQICVAYRCFNIIFRVGFGARPRTNNDVACGLSRAVLDAQRQVVSTES